MVITKADVRDLIGEDRDGHAIKITELKTIGWLTEAGAHHEIELPDDVHETDAATAIQRYQSLVSAHIGDTADDPTPH